MNQPTVAYMKSDNPIEALREKTQALQGLKGLLEHLNHVDGTRKEINKLGNKIAAGLEHAQGPAAYEGIDKQKRNLAKLSRLKEEQNRIYTPANLAGGELLVAYQEADKKHENLKLDLKLITGPSGTTEATEAGIDFDKDALKVTLYRKEGDQVVDEINFAVPMSHLNVSMQEKVAERVANKEIALLSRGDHEKQELQWRESDPEGQKLTNLQTINDRDQLLEIIHARNAGMVKDGKYEVFTDLETAEIVAADVLHPDVLRASRLEGLGISEEVLDHLQENHRQWQQDAPRYKSTIEQAREQLEASSAQAGATVAERSEAAKAPQHARG